MTEPNELEGIKQSLLDARGVIYAARMTLEPGQPYARRGEDDAKANVIQALYDAEDFLDRALHEIDPNLVS